jgi:16S rRNA C1402 (ribose-2'-O) methylase RsmI
LHFERLKDQRREFGVFREVEPDLLDQLLGENEVAVVSDADRDLVDDPVAALG